MKCYFCKADITSAHRLFVPAQNRREKDASRDVCTTCYTAIRHAEGLHVARVTLGVNVWEKVPGRHGLIGSVVTNGWPLKAKAQFRTVVAEEFTYLAGIDHRGEGHFIMWRDSGVESVDVGTYRDVLKDAKRAGLQPPFHIYGKYEVLQSPNVQFHRLTEKAIAVVG